MYFQELNYEETLAVDGGSVFKYIGAVGAIAFGVFEVYTGVAAVDGAKNIATGALTIVGGLIVLIS